MINKLFRLNVNTYCQQLISNPFSSIKNVPSYLLVVFLLALILPVSYLFFWVPGDPDGAVFDYIGWVMSEGGVAYVDAADQNWPGQMFIHMLSAIMFGNEIWSYKLFQIFIILPISCLILFFFLDVTTNRLTAISVVPIYQIMYMTSGYFASGQRDMIAGSLMVAAIFFLYQRIVGANRWFLAFQALFIFFATMIRPTLLVLAPVLFALDVCLMSKSTRKFIVIFIDHCIVGLVIIMLFALLAVYGLSNGSLAAWYDVSVKFSLEIYSQTKSISEIFRLFSSLLFNYWGMYILLSLCGAIVFFRKNIVALLLSLSLLPVAIISVVVQGKGFGYHWTMLYSLMGILMAIIVGYVASIIIQKKLSRCLLSFSLVVFLAAGITFMVKVRYAFGPQLSMVLGVSSQDEMYDRYLAGRGVTVKDALHAADYIKQSTDENSTVLFWGRPCYVNTLSKRRSPYFAASFALWQSPTPSFSSFDKWKSSLENVMQNKPPEILMLVKKDDGSGYRWLPEHPDENKIASVIVRHLPNYALEKTYGGIDLYRYKGKSVN